MKTNHSSTSKINLAGLDSAALEALMADINLQKQALEQKAKEQAANDNRLKIIMAVQDTFQSGMKQALGHEVNLDDCIRSLALRAKDKLISFLTPGATTVVKTARKTGAKTKVRKAGSHAHRLSDEARAALHADMLARAVNQKLGREVKTVEQICKEHKVSHMTAYGERPKPAELSAAVKATAQALLLAPAQTPASTPALAGANA